MKPILEIQNISKKFIINHEQKPYLSIRDSFTDIFKTKEKNKDFWALNDVSFTVDQGDTIGIIGRNGAGKSTLLKVLSKITPPTSGKIIGRGRIASLLEVGTGFHPELSGRENIFMNGSILGMRRFEILKNFDEIVDFSGVDNFIDTPLKHYSSGMQLRLAFAVSAFLENEILIIDEVLAVGDSEFQKKCMGKMGEVSKSGRTILFVSHNIGSLSQICTKGLVLNKGKVIFNGQIQNSISNYLNFQKNTIETNWVREKSFLPQNAMIFTNVYLTDNEQQTNEYLIDRDIFLNIEFDIRNKKEKFSVLVTILNNIQMPVFSSEIVIEKEHHILRIKKFTLQQGNYSFKLFLHIPALKCIDSIENCCNFNIIDTQTEWVKYNTHGYDHGNVFGNYIWE